MLCCFQDVCFFPSGHSLNDSRKWWNIGALFWPLHSNAFPLQWISLHFRFRGKRNLRLTLKCVRQRLHVRLETATVLLVYDSQPVEDDNLMMIWSRSRYRLPNPWYGETGCAKQNRNHPRLKHPLGICKTTLEWAHCENNLRKQIQSTGRQIINNLR